MFWSSTLSLLLLLTVQTPEPVASRADTLDIAVFKACCEAALSDLSAYRFEGRLAVNVAGLSFEIDTRMQAARDGRIEMAIRSPLEDIDYISDGLRTIVRFPRQAAYFVTDAARAAPAASSPPTLPLPFGRVPEFGMIMQGMLPPLTAGRFVRADSATVPASGGAGHVWSLVPGSAALADERAGDIIDMTLTVSDAGIIRRYDATAVLGADLRMHVTHEVERFEPAVFGANDFQVSRLEQGREVNSLEDLFLSMDLKGARAPQFTLPLSSGGSGSLSGQTGEITIIDFWATWCLPCQRQLKELTKLCEKDNRIRIVLISKEPLSVTSKYLGAHAPSLNTFCDERGKVHEAYGVQHLPTLVILDEDGIIREQTVGYHSCEDLLAIMDLLRHSQ